MWAFKHHLKRAHKGDGGEWLMRSQEEAGSSAVTSGSEPATATSSISRGTGVTSTMDTIGGDQMVGSTGD